jgi:hypothetical protein
VYQRGCLEQVPIELSRRIRTVAPGGLRPTPNFFGIPMEIDFRFRSESSALFYAI